MFNHLKKSTLALTAVAALALPTGPAAAEIMKKAGVYVQEDTSVVVRNDTLDYDVREELLLPAGFEPEVGACYMWYPDRAADTMPESSACGVDIPAGAVMIVG